MVRCWLPGGVERERMLLVRIGSCKVQPRTNSHGGGGGPKQLMIWNPILMGKRVYRFLNTIDSYMLLTTLEHIHEPSTKSFVQGFCVAQARSTLRA